MYAYIGHNHNSMLLCDVECFEKSVVNTATGFFHTFVNSEFNFDKEIFG